MRASSSRTDLPSRSRADRAVSSGKTLQKTPEPIMTGTKRVPSSLVQMTSSSGASVWMPRSCSVRMTSSPAMTPKQPSNLPPVGWVSIWLPVATGSLDGSVPGRRPKMLPTWSTVTSRPASRIQPTTRSRPWPSNSVRARRQLPPFSVAPMRASSIRDCHRRWPLIEISEIVLIIFSCVQAAAGARPCKKASSAGPMLSTI